MHSNLEKSCAHNEAAEDGKHRAPGNVTTASSLTLQMICHEFSAADNIKTVSQQGEVVSSNVTSKVPKESFICRVIAVKEQQY